MAGDTSSPRDGADKDLRVYYDGRCPLCRAEIDHYRRCEGADRLDLVDVGRDETAALGPGLSRERALGRFHVRDAQGRLLSGAAAFARLWRVLPGWRWLARIVEVRILGFQPLLLVAEVAYRLFLPLRPWLARGFARFRSVTGRSRAPGTS